MKLGKARPGALIGLLAALLTVAVGGGAIAYADSTAVKGHQGPRYDADNNGISDAGVFVTGHYTSFYAEDGNGDYYWDLGDGRIYSTVPSVADLDQASLTTCDYVNNYRADFGNDPFMDTGWIINNITCKGADPGTYTYLIVHEDDPRYTGNPNTDVWGTWEYHVLSQSGSGNLVKTQPSVNL